MNKKLLLEIGNRDLTIKDVINCARNKDYKIKLSNQAIKNINTNRTWLEKEI